MNAINIYINLQMNMFDVHMEYDGIYGICNNNNQSTTKLKVNFLCVVYAMHAWFYCIRVL